MHNSSQTKWIRQILSWNLITVDINGTIGSQYQSEPILASKCPKKYHDFSSFIWNLQRLLDIISKETQSEKCWECIKKVLENCFWLSKKKKKSYRLSLTFGLLTISISMCGAHRSSNDYMKEIDLLYMIIIQEVAIRNRSIIHSSWLYNR